LTPARAAGTFSEQLFAKRTQEVAPMRWQTRFGSLDSYEKGGVEVINDDPKNYAFSNIFEVASHARPFEHIVVGKNFEYVLEVVRVEGTSAWRACSHDETALVMDGEVKFEFRTMDDAVPLPEEGSVTLADEPAGRPVGRIVARRGHMTLLPARRAYRYSSGRPAVLLVQTVAGPDSQFRWSEICQTA
jgi:hypothetical protein